MIEKLKELKSRTEYLRYKDEKELDDILQKTKMYVGKMFPINLTYCFEIESIKFKPSSFVSGMDEQIYRDSWTSGQQKLINYIDTRIEEKELELKTQPKTNVEPRVIQNVISVQDNTRIKELTQENTELRKRKDLWNRINWTIVITSSLTALGGAFLLGIYIGKAQFDNEKIELFQKNQTLENRNDSLTKEIGSANVKIQNFTKLIPENFEVEPLFPMEISLSFYSPTSIFDGEILVTAKNQNNDKVILEFKGIHGISKKLTEPYDSLYVEVKAGDRFYFKSEKGLIYAVNILSTIIDVDIEITETK